VGGAEHAVLHLLYSRFWHKVLYDRGYLPSSEPFQRLVNQGMILATEYRIAPADRETHAGKVAQLGLRVLEVKSDDGAVLVLKTPDPKPNDPDKVKDLTDDQVDNRKGKLFLKGTKIELTSAAEKMSKSRGNVINPDEVVDDYGADSLRLYEMF